MDNGGLHGLTYLDNLVGKAAFEGIDHMTAFADVLIKPLQTFIRYGIQRRYDNQLVFAEPCACRLDKVAFHIQLIQLVI
ncbi:hypothetical protein D3C79_959450 [compost metagenome]